MEAAEDASTEEEVLLEGTVPTEEDDDQMEVEQEQQPEEGSAAVGPKGEEEAISAETVLVPKEDKETKEPFPPVPPPAEAPAEGEASPSKGKTRVDQSEEAGSPRKRNKIEPFPTPPNPKFVLKSAEEVNKEKKASDKDEAMKDTPIVLKPNFSYRLQVAREAAAKRGKCGTRTVVVTGEERELMADGEVLYRYSARIEARNERSLRRMDQFAERIRLEKEERVAKGLAPDLTDEEKAARRQRNKALRLEKQFQALQANPPKAGLGLKRPPERLAPGGGSSSSTVRSVFLRRADPKKSREEVEPPSEGAASKGSAPQAAPKQEPVVPPAQPKDSARSVETWREGGATGRWRHQAWRKSDRR